MDYSLGYSAKYHACLVDPATWADEERIEILAGNVNRESTGLRQSADINCVDYADGSDKWIRIWMEAEQGGDADNEPLFTGLTSAPEEIIEGTYSESTVECYSVLKPAQDVLLPRGWFASKGFIGTDIIKSLLSVTPAPVVVESGSPRLSQHIVAESGESNLSMIDKILTAINWRMRIDGDGTITVCPYSKEERVVFSALSNDAIEPSVTRTNDMFNCPNVFRAVSDTASYTVYDRSDSALSITSRGREVWKEESSVKLNDGETLAAYANRRLKELQSVGEELSFDRSYSPDLQPTDKIRLNYPAQDLSGIFIVKSQKIKLDHCATTSEEVIRD